MNAIRWKQGCQCPCLPNAGIDYALLPWIEHEVMLNRLAWHERNMQHRNERSEAIVNKNLSLMKEVEQQQTRIAELERRVAEDRMTLQSMATQHGSYEEMAEGLRVELHEKVKELTKERDELRAEVEVWKMATVKERIARDTESFLREQGQQEEEA